MLKKQRLIKFFENDEIKTMVTAIGVGNWS